MRPTVAKISRLERECLGVNVPSPPDWHTQESEVLEKLKKHLDEDSEEWKWLQRAVHWKAPDLELATTDEVLAAFRKTKLNNALLLRTLIWQAWIKIQAELMEPVEGNVRSFWYQTVEPFYRRHNLIQDDLSQAPQPGSPEVLVRMRLSASDRVESTMTEMVGEFVAHRIFEYGGAFKFQPGIDNICVRGKNLPRILFFTEKDGMVWLSKWICAESQISVMTSKGQPSFVALEYFAKQLKAKTGKLLIGCFCDWDPWGYAIAEQVDAKLRFLGCKPTTYMLTSLKLFSPAQIASAHDLSTDLHYLKKKAVVDAWLAKGGGVDGKPMAIHIDVIPKPYKMKLAETFVDAAQEDALDRNFHRIKPVTMDPSNGKHFV